MSLLAPDPTRTAPLPLRAQADIRDRWLSERLLELLPVLMDRTGIDLWVVAGRECNEDPVLATLLPATWLSARRRTVLLLHRSDDGVTPVAVSRYPVGLFLPADTADDDAAPDDEWAVVRRFVEQADPARIGIDVSADFAHADGLSHTEHAQLVAALGPWADRLVPAEQLAVGWLETRLPGEVAALHGLYRLTCEVVTDAFAAVAPGRTTAIDLAWALRQRMHDLGVEPWFQPSVTLQRAGVPLAEQGGALLPAVPFDAVVEPGDLVHCDLGLTAWGCGPTPSAPPTCCAPARPKRPPACASSWPRATGCRTSPSPSCGRAGPATRCWRRPARPPRPRASRPTSTRTRSACTGTAPVRRSAGGTGSPGCPARVTTRSASTPPGPWSSRCGSRWPSGTGSASGWGSSRASC